MRIQRAIASLKSKIIAPLGIEPPFDEHMSSNGEVAFLSRLEPPRENDCIVDVGAARGEWTAEAIKFFPTLDFILFEPIPLYAARLRESFAENVTVHQCVLSDETRDGTIHSVGIGGRIHVSQRNLAGTKKLVEILPVRYETGDRMLAGRKPYMIKIDCEGHDAKVIRGFKNVLEVARPILQFEYCEFWLLANETLRDTSAFLTERGYRLFRIFPDRLEPFTYRRTFETYNYQNFVAMTSAHMSV